MAEGEAQGAAPKDAAKDPLKKPASNPSGIARADKGPGIVKRAIDRIFPRRAQRARELTEYKEAIEQIIADPEQMEGILADAFGLSVVSLPKDDGTDSTNPKNSQSPDRAYLQKDLIRDPRTGKLIPAMEYLDDAHLQIRAREFIDQESNPRPEPQLIPTKEIPKHAFELLMSLQEAVRLWPVDREQVLDTGEILRDYNTTLEHTEGDLVGRKTFFTAQLTYANRESTTPVYGNLSVIKPTKGWQREYYFQANPTSRRNDKPLIYYDDYPYHEESTGRPVENDFYAVQRARELIAEVPRTT